MGERLTSYRPDQCCLGLLRVSSSVSTVDDAEGISMRTAAARRVDVFRHL